MPYGGPAETAMVRSSAVSEILSAQVEVLKNREKVDLHDAEAVRMAAADYLRQCAERGTLPNLEGLAFRCGISRRWIYEFLSKYPDSESAKFLDLLRTGMASARISAMDKGAVDVAGSIFILLNSSLGYSNNHQIELIQPTNPLDVSAGDVAAVRQRYLDALPDTENDYKENL